MRVIFKIAVTELQVLFYSPVAWLILIVFAFQSSMAFTDQVGQYVQTAGMGYPIGNLTLGILSAQMGAFSKILNYLYLYIPLLTMGLMSRELSSGSIKMLYSSPVRNSQIIFGKYLAMMVYGLILIFILGIFCVWLGMSVENVDIPVMLSGLLGIYLLICAYSAVGLLMSSLTSYQVVAAICTLATLSLLNYIGNIGQGIGFVREITYWLSMSGRASQFIRGLISTEDLLYFVIVIALFLGLCIVRMNSARQKSGWKSAALKYAGVVLLAVTAGYISSRPTMKRYCDVTQTKQNTLTEQSQDIIRRLEGGLTIHTFVNILEPNYWMATPRYQKTDYQNFAQYIRFKPQIKMKYHYYYAPTPNSDLEQRYPNLTDEQRVGRISLAARLDSTMFVTKEEIARIVDLEPEGYRFVRMLERDNGQRVFLRIFDDMFKYPSEAEISAALKRLVMELPVVGFLQGHGDRGFDPRNDHGYSRIAMQPNFRQSLVNQGFDFTTVTLDDNIPENITVLVVSDIRTPLSEEELQRLRSYIDRGGNMVLLGDVNRRETMAPVAAMLGVEFQPGQIVQINENMRADVVLSNVLPDAGRLSYVFQGMIDRGFMVAKQGCVGVTSIHNKGFTVLPLLATRNTATWNEFETTNFAEDTVRLNTAAGEVEGSYITALALSREIGGREQKIVVLGDADCIANEDISKQWADQRTANYNMIMGVFHWMSDGEVPIDVRRPTPPDNKLKIDPKGLETSKWVLHAGMPALLIALFLIIILPRRKK